MKKSIVPLFFLLILSACVTQRKGATGSVGSIGSLRLIGSYELPYNFPFKGTTVGGLSGIDYDSKDSIYYLICDDRSAINAARFYTARIYLTEKSIDSVSIIGTTTLLQPDGARYPSSKEYAAHAPDPEAMRYDPTRQQLIWSSEGERNIKENETVLEDPSIRIISRDGKYLDSIALPENLRMRASENGPRQNGVLEGMSFADDYQTLYVSLEEPRYEDGPRADTVENNAWVRIYKFDTKSKRNTAQFAYRLSPLAYPAVPADAFKVNGIPDILCIDGKQLLVMERSFSTGRPACTIRIYLADMSNADDIKNITSLNKHHPIRPISKKLLLNMDDLGMYIDNVEGMTFGPRLPNGHATLLMVADNNFSQLEKSQFFLFEIAPEIK